MKAQATENQTQKQLRTPNFPYLKALQEKAPIAHNGAKIQKTIIWVYLDAFHQQTMFIPKFKLLAAMHQPRQKAKMFLKTQVMMLICFSGTSPIDTQVMKMKKVKAIKRNEATTTAGLFPMSKTTVQMIFKAFVIPKQMWVFKLHTFLIKLQMLAKIKPPQMTAQIAKKNPGGVVYRLNLSETSLFLLIPKRQLTKRVQPNNIGVKILIGHWNLPSTPKAAQFLRFWSAQSEVVSSFCRYDMIKRQNIVILGNFINFFYQFGFIIKLSEYDQKPSTGKK